MRDDNYLDAGPQPVKPLARHEPPKMFVDMPSHVSDMNGISGYSVGQSNLGNQASQGSVAVIFRYVVVIAADLAVVREANLQYQLTPLSVLVLLAGLTFGSVIILSLIDTRQAFGLANSLLDFSLNRRRMNHLTKLETRKLEIWEGLAQYELRHRQNLERWRTMHDLGMLKTQTAPELPVNRKKAATLAKRVVTDEPGALVDTVAEDQMAEQILGFLMSFYVLDIDGNLNGIKKNGEILVPVPWAPDNGMDEADQKMALKMIRTVNTKAPQPVLTKKKGKDVWTFNKRFYERPAQVIAAFDSLYR